MKLIIDTEVIKDLLETEWGYKGLMDDLDDLFAKNGIPLDKIRDEIEPYAYENKYEECIRDDMTGWICAWDALKIIDRYREEKTMDEVFEYKATFTALKILPEYFEQVDLGMKTFELRRDDRDYEVGDQLLLQEFDGENHTGRWCTRYISYILRDCPEYGLMDGFCILGLSEVPV